MSFFLFNNSIQKALMLVSVPIMLSEMIYFVTN